ncbi:MAG: TlpA disulfide reductase family protein [Pseudomonas sp.]
MKTGLGSGILVAALLLVGCGEGGWLDHQGNRISSADLDGRWVVVNYWAEWCAPCRHELPEFNRLAQGNPHVAVLGINYDGVSGDQLSELADAMGIEFPVMGQDFIDSYRLETPIVLPTTYVFNPAGELLHSLAGPQTEQTLLALLD